MLSPLRFAALRIVVAALVVAFVAQVQGPVALRIAMAALAVLTALGVERRFVSVPLLLLWGWFVRTRPEFGSPVLLLPAAILAALALAPAGEPLALSARGATGPFRMPERLFDAAWFWFALTSAAAAFQSLLPPGTTAATGPQYSFFAASLLFAALFAPFRKTRSAAFALAVCAAVTMDDTFGTFGTLSWSAMLFFLFDARWIPGGRRGAAVIFFDGYCGLCDRVVDFLLSEDVDGRLLFTPLQGKTAAAELTGKAKLDDPESIVFRDEGGVHFASTAVLRATARMGGLYWLVRGFLAVPAAVRDGIYAVVAKNRYKIFGKRETCRLPTPEERSRFLD